MAPRTPGRTGGPGTARILVLTFYYPPDLSAGSFRVTALVEALLRELPSSVGIDVLTTLPNRYRTFRRNAAEVEDHGRLRIRRIDLPPHSSGTADQARSFLRFAREVDRRTRGEEYELVFATSSRLMTAALGAWIARRSRSPLYLDIRDLFVDTIREVLSWKGVILRPLFGWLERWTVRTAEHVNLVSPGFESYFEQRYPEQEVSYFTNGIDERFLGDGDPTGPGPEAEDPVSPPPITIVYAGNMGEGQGLHTIIPPLARRLRGRARFRLIGDGGRRPLLEEAIERDGVDNVTLVAPMPRAHLIQEYRKADVLFLHLNDYEAFEKVLPSKIFEYAALGKPIWAGVSGYSARFLKDEVSNVAVFPPCDADAALEAFAGLELCDRPRDPFIDRFRRRKIMTEMARDIRRHLRREAP